MIDQIREYLTLPNLPTGPLAGVRWSNNGEAIEHEDGRTVILAAQLSIFLEGFGKQRRLPSLVTILHLLTLLGFGRSLEEISREEWQLNSAQLFLEAGCPLRNAGALLAEAAREVPAIPQALDIDGLCRRLRSQPLMASMALNWLTYNQTWASLTHTLQVQDAVKSTRDYLIAMPTEELRHWLKHGCPSLKPIGDEIAQILPPPEQRTLGNVLADLAQRPRLAAAVPFVAQFVSALALPPRRLVHNQIPIGGYADVTTRGQPEQILPGQLALDSLEFVRRFSQNELLFYRREEPHASVREELILLLDQGVRTWGTVRLVLAAAALALGRRAERGKMAVRFAFTSVEGFLVDPLTAKPDELSEMFEASDFTMNPGTALERVLAQIASHDDDIARDVVLLTQRCNVAEEEVAVVARRMLPTTRLFAVAVEETGEGELSELRRGHAVKVRDFRVDLTLAAPKPGDVPHVPVEAPRPWTGDVEPIGFPFQTSVIDRKNPDHRFEFDGSGEWILESGRGGYLQAWRVDGTAAEVMPRGLWMTEGPKTVERIIGVQSGFVVVVTSRTLTNLFHYDLEHRHCRSLLGNGEPKFPSLWYYIPERHWLATPFRNSYLALNLNPGVKPGQARIEADASEPFHEGWVKQFLQIINHQPQPVVMATGEQHHFHYSLSLSHDGYLMLMKNNGASGWARFALTRDGQNLFQTHKIVSAWIHDETLLFRLQSLESVYHFLFAVRGPEGTPLGEFSIQAGQSFRAIVSRNGKWLVRLTSRGRLEAQELGGTLVRRDPFPPSPQSNRLSVYLGEEWVTAVSFGHSHFVSWRNGQWFHTTTRQSPHALIREYLRVPNANMAHRHSANPNDLPADLDNDRERWATGCRFHLELTTDIHGHILLRKPHGQIVAVFLVRGSQFAAWMPDGVRWGPSSLIGGASTPGAEQRLARSLHEAWGAIGNRQE